MCKAERSPLKEASDWIRFNMLFSNENGGQYIKCDKKDYIDLSEAEKF